MQRLAPNVINSSYTPNLYAYTLAFTGQEVNYAAAVSFLLGLVIVIGCHRSPRRSVDVVDLIDVRWSW